MKKILLTLTAVMAIATASAKVYSDNLIIQVNDVATDPIPADVNIEINEDGTMDLSLNNFWFMLEDDAMFVGNIVVDKVALAPVENSVPSVSTFKDSRVIRIEPGTGIVYEGEFVEIPESNWVGPLLEDVPIEMKGQYTEDKVFLTIDINMVTLGQVITVTYSSPIEYTIDDAIRPVSNDGQQNIKYDLSGRPVKNQSKGISVVSGKKVLRNNK